MGRYYYGRRRRYVRRYTKRRSVRRRSGRRFYRRRAKTTPYLWDKRRAWRDQARAAESERLTAESCQRNIERTLGLLVAGHEKTFERDHPEVQEYVNQRVSDMMPELMEEARKEIQERIQIQDPVVGA